VDARVERDAKPRSADPEVVELEQPEQADRRPVGLRMIRERRRDCNQSVRTVRPGIMVRAGCTSARYGR